MAWEPGDLSCKSWSESEDLTTSSSSVQGQDMMAIPAEAERTNKPFPHLFVQGGPLTYCMTGGSFLVTLLIQILLSARNILIETPHFTSYLGIL